MTNCQGEKSNTRLTDIGDSFELRVSVMVTRALKAICTNGLSTCGVEKEMAYNRNIRKDDTIVYIGIQLWWLQSRPHGP